LKQDIKLGAYGWRHAHWSTTFYPEDLPVEEDDDWRLAYYSNEFNTVMVPWTYWQTEPLPDCEKWLDDVHDDFRFFIECHADMFEFISPAEFTDCLKKLGPKLSALVFLDDRSVATDSLESLNLLIDTLGLDVFTTGDTASLTTKRQVQNIWRPDKVQTSSFAFIEDDLLDLRSARVFVEDFVASICNEGHKPEQSTEQQPGLQSEQQSGENDGQFSMIVSHPQLQASDLGRFRSVLEIMGC